jgi:hypothetical protein
MNYLGRLHGYYPPDLDDAARIDVTIGGIEDVSSIWSEHFYGKEKTADDIAAALPRYREAVAPWLANLERMSAKYGCSTWTVKLQSNIGAEPEAATPAAGGPTDDLTLADFFAFEAFDAALRAAPDILGPYPKLKQFVADFAARPNIRKYIHNKGLTTRLVPHTGGPDKLECLRRHRVWERSTWMPSLARSR